MQAVGYGLARIGAGGFIRSALGGIGRGLMRIGSRFIAPTVERLLGKVGVSSAVASQLTGQLGQALMKKGTKMVSGAVMGLLPFGEGSKKSKNYTGLDKPSFDNNYEFAKRRKGRGSNEMGDSEWESKLEKRQRTNEIGDDNFRRLIVDRGDNMIPRTMFQDTDDMAGMREVVRQ